MTKREFELFCLLCEARKSHDDACPGGVGMGPFPSTIVDWVCRDLSFEVSPEDRRMAANVIREKLWQS